MHLRKLVKSGYSSLVAALPKSWLERNKLKSGDVVAIQEEGTFLKITPQQKGAPKQETHVVIQVNGQSDHIIKREIIAAYMNNYMYITLKGESIKERSRHIKKVIYALAALELVEESLTQIIAKNFLNIPDTDLKLLIKRVDNIIRSMFIEMREVVKDPKHAAVIMERDIEINRLIFLIAKILKAAYLEPEIRESVHMDSLTVLRYWELHGRLETIGDRVKNIAELFPDLKPKYHASFFQLFDAIEKLYISSMKSFYHFSIAESDAVSAERTKVIALIKVFMVENNNIQCSQIATNAYNLVSNINHIGRIVRYLD